VSHLETVEWPATDLAMRKRPASALVISAGEGWACSAAAGYARRGPSVSVAAVERSDSRLTV
jgi:hypothetical protein